MTIARRSDSQLLVVDVQERLAPAMADLETTLANIAILASAGRALGIPATLSEQYPKGLGPTLSRVLDACGADAPALAKLHFSCGRDPAILTRIAGLSRSQIVVCGLESHVCVLQTALDLKSRGFDVFVAIDATDSRRAESKALARDRLTAAGVCVATTEMIVFEWLEQAGTAQFKAVSPLLR